MVVCKPVYDFTIKNGLRSRWRVLEKPKATKSRSRVNSNLGTPKSNSSLISITSLKSILLDSKKMNYVEDNYTLQGIDPTTIAHISEKSNLIENEYFCIVSWQPWAVVAQIAQLSVVDDYAFYILLRDHLLKPLELHKRLLNRTSNSYEKDRAKYASKQLFRIIGFANSKEEILEDWNCLMNYIMPKIDKSVKITVYDVEKMIKDFRLNERCTDTDVEITEDGTILTKRVKSYLFIEDLGRGAYAQIKLAKHEDTMGLYALKLIPQSSDNMEVLLNEISITLDICHPHVMQIHEVIDCQQYICMVLTYCRTGTLSDYLAKNEGNIDPQWVKRCGFGICLGLQYLHSLLIIHRDLKPENILLDDRLNPRISDFGLAVTLEYKNQKLKMFGGTLGFVAPEVTKLQYLGQPADIWSIGVVLYYLLRLELPFPDSVNHNDPLEYLECIESYNLVDRLEGLDEDSSNLLTRMLINEPLKRIKMPQILKHKWFKDQKEQYDFSVKSNVKSSPERKKELKILFKSRMKSFLKLLEESWCMYEPADEFKSKHPEIRLFTRQDTKQTSGQICALAEGKVYATVEDIYNLRETLISRSGEQGSLHRIELVDDNIETIYYCTSEAYMDMFKGTEVKSDLCILLGRRRLSDGRFVLSYSSIEDEHCPVQSGIRRSNFVCGGYVVTPLGPGVCNVTFCQNYDMNMKLSDENLEQLYMMTFESIGKMRAEIAKRKGINFDKKKKKDSHPLLQ